MLKNGTPASPAIARASSVLPVPGAPIRSTPFGTLPPRRVYLAGSFRKSTISISCALASSMPATSAKVTARSPTVVCSYRLAWLLPMPNTPPPIWPTARFDSHSKPPISSSVGPTLSSSVSNGF